MVKISHPPLWAKVGDKVDAMSIFSFMGGVGGYFSRQVCLKWHL